jgi:sugar/nucleoside kinase (ribokinase family)
MYRTTHLPPVDYLVIGHLAQDLTPSGPRLGGTAAYASLTASALGLRVGIITSWGSELPLGPLDAIPIINLPSINSTTFENIATPEGRLQIIHNVAHNLDLNLIPDPWLKAPIVHLGPIAQEVEPGLVRHFSSSLIGMTPQGWLRKWDQHGRVSSTEWPESAFVLGQAGAAVISLEDVDGDESRIEEMASACRVLAVTENVAGARVFWSGDVRRFRSMQLPEIDATGAGDIFAAAFFFRLYTTRDPWEAGRFATQLASFSITRPGLEGIPTQDEIQECLVEVF